LYRWEVRLFDFDGEMAKDLSRLGKKAIELEMRFSKDYPFAPPFVRVSTSFFSLSNLCLIYIFVVYGFVIV